MAGEAPGIRPGSGHRRGLWKPFVPAILAILLHPAAAAAAAAVVDVDSVVRPLMQRYAIPGMAVGVIDGDETRLQYFGTASIRTGQPVDRRSLFEIGSISKTFLATLTALAAADGKLTLSDTVGADFPPLRGTPIGAVTLERLGTHTPGGMPLQFPDAVTSDRAALAWLRSWKPRFCPGTERTYANPSIGLLGLITATRLGGDFGTVEPDRVFRPLGLHDTFLDIPPERGTDLALGTTATGASVRMSPGPLGIEAYGVRTTAADLLRFLRANLGLLALDPSLAQAILVTHTGYARIGPMTQDLVWEQYPEAAPLADLLAGNGPAIASHPQPATPIVPPEPPRADAILNKTGSTDGFGAYVLFIPARRIAIVLLANRNYPIEARVTAAWRILASLPH